MYCTISTDVVALIQRSRARRTSAELLSIRCFGIPPRATLICLWNQGAKKVSSLQKFLRFPFRLHDVWLYIQNVRKATPSLSVFPAHDVSWTIARYLSQAWYSCNTCAVIAKFFKPSFFICPEDTNYMFQVFRISSLFLFLLY